MTDIPDDSHEDFVPLQRRANAAAMGAAVGALAHALGTPLNVILGRVNMLEASLEPNKHIDSIALQAGNMSKLIRRVVDRLAKMPPGGPAMVHQTGVAATLRRALAPFKHVTATVHSSVEKITFDATALAVAVRQILIGSWSPTEPGQEPPRAVVLNCDVVTLDQPHDPYCIPGSLLRVILTDKEPGKPTRGAVPIRWDNVFVGDESEHGDDDMALAVAARILRDAGGMMERDAANDNWTIWVPAATLTKHD